MHAHRTLAALALAALTLGPGTCRAAVVRIAQGELEGDSQAGVIRYLGIPYAAAPVGDLRWKAPQPAPAWSGVLHAGHYAPNCQQAPAPTALRAWTHEYLIEGPIGEDCLYLNVWTPQHPPAARLPVLVWIHGGAFTSGGATVPIYDGARFAARGVVVVSINYRLGVYGFLSHPALRQENDVHAAGNYGLQDAVAALRWVHENIDAFGGDPARVTVAGQSAGAAAVHDLIASPLAHGLFARAIAQSGSGKGMRLPDGASADATGLQLAANAGAADIAALRRLTPAQIDAAAGGLHFGPSVDGLVLPDAGHVGRNTNDVPVLTGWTADEGSSMADNYTVGSNDARAARDSALASAQDWAMGHGQPVYLYLFSYVEPGPEAARYGAFHSSEIPYVFDTLAAAPERRTTPADAAVARTVGAYWANFVKHGDPYGAHLPAWPRLQAAAPRVLEFDAGGRAVARKLPLQR